MIINTRVTLTQDDLKSILGDWMKEMNLAEIESIDAFRSDNESEITNIEGIQLFLKEVTPE